MAYEKDLNKKEEEQNGMDTLTQQSSAIPTSGPQNFPAQQREPQQKAGSGMFTNIQKYYQPNAEKEAVRMAGDIGTQYKKDVENVKQQTDQKINQWNQETQPELNRLQTAGERTAQYIQEAGNTDQEVLAQRAAELDKLRAGQYQTPNDINLSEQKLAQENIIKNVGNLTEDSTKEALKNIYNRPDYSSGMRNLDYMFMRQQGARDALGQQSKEAVQQMQDYNVLGKEAAIRDQAANIGNLAKSYTEGGERDINQQFNQAEVDLKAQIAAREQEEQARRVQVIRDSIGSSGIGSYITDSGPLTEEQLITPEQIAKTQALNNLAGRQLNIALQQNQMDPAQLEQVKEQLRNYGDYNTAQKASNFARMANLENNEAGLHGYTSRALQKLGTGDLTSKEGIQEYIDRIRNFKEGGRDSYDSDGNKILVDRYSLGSYRPDAMQPMFDINGGDGLMSNYLKELAKKREVLARYGINVDDEALKKLGAI